MSQDHSTRAHALIGGSKVKQAKLCRGSIMLQEQFLESESSPAALRGTAIHEIAEAMLDGRETNVGDEEMIRVAKGYVAAIKFHTPNAKKLLVEHSVADVLAELHPALGGSIDLVAIGGGELLICDLKTGREIVHPEENAQLLTYALGAAMSLKAPNNVKVRLAIYQPANGGWNEWVTDMSRLKQWKNELLEIAITATAPNAPLTPSSDACKWCRAKAACPAIKEKVLQSARVEFQQITPELLVEAELAGIWADSVKDGAKLQLITNPGSIVGWHLKPGRKMVTWKSQALAEKYFKDQRDAWTLKSVSAVQKVVFDLPAELINETSVAASLARVKE